MFSKFLYVYNFTLIFKFLTEHFFVNLLFHNFSLECEVIMVGWTNNVRGQCKLLLNILLTMITIIDFTIVNRVLLFGSNFKCLFKLSFLIFE